MAESAQSSDPSVDEWVFEAPEKKVELAVVEGAASLRQIDAAKWHEVVSRAHAEVLSVRSNDFFDSYLLSESSLFVFDNFVTMITCGQTRLVDAVLAMLELIPKEDVAVLMYERKNENFPHTQFTTFRHDAEVLRQTIGGRALRFGAEHEHAIRLFHTTRDHDPDDDDTTIEVLMHSICPDRADSFKPGQDMTWLHEAFENLLPGFEVHDHVFEPAGYSLNALKDQFYYTLHVTPERGGSYVSFETNLDFRDQVTELVLGLVDVFRPNSFDVMTFVPRGHTVNLTLPRFHVRRRVSGEASGYHVEFTHFFVEDLGVEEAMELPISK